MIEPIKQVEVNGCTIKLVDIAMKLKKNDTSIYAVKGDDAMMDPKTNKNVGRIWQSDVKNKFGTNVCSCYIVTLDDIRCTVT